MIAPTAPSTAPTASDWPPAEERVAPDRPPITSRAINEGGAVRLGVFGNLSFTYSPSAAKDKMATAIGNSMNRSGKPCKLTKPKWPAKPTLAEAATARAQLRCQYLRPSPKHNACSSGNLSSH